jgi:hypothetical protein
MQLFCFPSTFICLSPPSLRSLLSSPRLADALVTRWVAAIVRRRGQTGQSSDPAPVAKLAPANVPFQPLGAMVALKPT